MKETVGESKVDSFLSKSVDFVFSKDERKWLLLIVLLGVILRVIVASNLPPVADEMVHGTHAIGVSKLAPLSTMTQGPVWFYLTDYAYRIFGVHLLTARFLSVIFGSVSIVLVYLIASMLFNKKAGLVAAFLLAVSIFHITWTASYHDQTMMFFVLLASYFFIKIYQEKKQISLLSAVFLGIAILVKIITGIFIVIFGLFMLGILYKDFMEDKKRFRHNLKKTIIFGLILLIASAPILTYNYLLYKEKGIVDLPLAQFLRINAEFYTGPGLAHGEGFVINKLPRNLYTVITHYFVKEDLLSFLIGLGGIGYVVSRWKEKRFGELFLLTMLVVSLAFIASAIVLQTHYTSFFPLFSIFGGAFIVAAKDRLKDQNHRKYLVYGVIIVMLVFTLYSLRSPLTSQSAVEKARSLAADNFDDNTLVFVDSRIYIGTYTWMFHDRAYVDASQLPSILQWSNQSGRTLPLKTLFIECVTDDCGWGTIKDQPMVNQSMESIITQFASISTAKAITGGGGIRGVRGNEEVRGDSYYRIYTATIPLNPEVLNVVKQTHSHFFYHIPRNENPQQAFDYYPVNGGIDNLVNILSYGVLYVMLFVSIVSIGIPFYILARKGSD